MNLQQTDKVGYAKDVNSGAILSTDDSEFRQYKIEREFQRELRTFPDRIKRLEEQLAELLEINRKPI